MDNKVYYGQYSLRHWIDLILKENIILPDYQRHFVWKEDDVKRLIVALKNKQFVPPITIGAFKKGDTNNNLILDGQQRLTSVLLAYLGYFPNEKKYKLKKENILKFANENGDEDEESDEEEIILEWTFKALIQEGKNKIDILGKIKDTEYKKIELDINDKFLNETFLGFSYLIPNVENEKQQQKYYSTVFRSINNEGKPLLAQESRASLYFLDKDLVDFFNPEFIGKLSVKNTGSADFVRYVSILSQYKKDGNSNRVARGFKSIMESYYEKYIYSVVGENDAQIFVDFLTIFPNKEFKNKFEALKKTIDDLSLPKQFTSIIELDLFLFGLIYFIVFENKKINIAKKDELKKELEDASNEFKDEYSHSKAPSALKYLKERIDKSIEITNKYAS
jgi:hypothetical protein